MELLLKLLLFFCVINVANCGTCKDSKTNCRVWAKNGFCRKSPKYMRTNCGLSCKFCRVTTGSCVFEGRTYRQGVKFVSRSCNRRCTCRGSNGVSCVSLCPPYGVMCKPGETKNYFQQKVSDSPRCYCRRPKCVSRIGSCVFEGRTYRQGVKFVSQSCNRRCTCRGSNGVSCVSLCPPYGVTCKYGETKTYFQQKVSDSPRCYCRRPKCVSRNSCKHQGRTYRKGQRFVSQSCDGRCTCKGFNGVSCVSLCPPYGVNCRSWQTKLFYLKKVSDRPKCYCKRPKCVSTR